MTPRRHSNATVGAMQPRHRSRAARVVVQVFRLPDNRPGESRIIEGARVTSETEKKTGQPSGKAAFSAELGIPMRDEIELAADVYFPDSGSLPAPVILTM